jgi:hypothetical protein
MIRLIRQMWKANPTWGIPRIRDKLAKPALQASTSIEADKVHAFRACTLAGISDNSRLASGAEKP